MLVVETIVRIRRERPGKVTPIRKPVRDLKVARNTIRKAMHDAWRQAGMDGARWAGLRAGHESEILELTPLIEASAR